MKQELESILSFGAQAVSGEKTIFDQAALRHLDRLMEGNSGYKTTPANPAVLSQELREGTAKNGQSPLAVIVCCSDSRVPPEHIFHAGIGELFIIRNAGNLISDFALGSVEYAVEHLETPLVVVMGHTGCGAVGTALTPAQERAAWPPSWRKFGTPSLVSLTPTRPCARTPSTPWPRWGAAPF